MQLVRGQLSRMQRSVLSALIVIEVHAKDVAANLVEEGISSVNDFEWISQLRSGNLPSGTKPSTLLSQSLCSCLLSPERSALFPGITGPGMTCMSGQ